MSTNTNVGGTAARHRIVVTRDAWWDSDRWRLTEDGHYRLERALHLTAAFRDHHGDAARAVLSKENSR